MITVWSPATDILLSNTCWRVKLEVAGVNPNELEITIRENILRIEGCRRDIFTGDEFSYQMMEIRYYRFEREITLPFTIDPGKVSWQYQHGMLLVDVARE